MPTAGGGAPSVGDAVNYGWAKFQQHVGPILIGEIIIFVAVIVVSVIWQMILGAIFSGTDSLVAFLFVFGISQLGSFVMQYFLQAAITRGALALTYGQPPTMNTFLSTDGLPQVLIASLLLGLATAVGFILCIIPGIIVVFAGQFTVHFVLDKRLEPVEAIKASFQLVQENVGTVITFFIVGILITIAGAIACGVGLLVAYPVVFIGQTYLYRRLQGEPVAA